MRTYQSDRAAPLPGILTTLLYGLLASAVAGGILFSVEHFLHFYLIILFPVGAAFLVAIALSAGITAGRLRNPLVAGLIGLLSAVAVEGTYHALSYQFDFKAAVAQELGASDPKLVGQLGNVFLQQEVGATGFPGYLKFEAQQGIKLSKFGIGGVGISGTGYWIYLLVETGLIALFCVGGAVGAAREPFNAATGRWYARQGAPLRATAADGEALQAALKAGQWDVAAALLTTADLPTPRLELSVWQSGDPGNVYVQLHHVDQIEDPKKKGETKREEKELLSGLLTQAELTQLSQGAAPRQPDVMSAPEGALAGA